MKLETKYIIALVNLYGMVRHDKVVEIFNMQNDDNISELSKLELGILKRSGVIQKYGHFTHEMIVDFEDEKIYLRAKERRPFYIPEKDELLKYTNESYIEMNKQYKALEKHLKNNYGISGDDLDDFLFSIIDHVNSNKDIMKVFEYTRLGELDFATMDDMKEVINLYLDCANNTRLWIYNGYTAAELGENVLERDIVKKVGRNDLCYCGSGKKYKKCCLKSDEQKEGEIGETEKDLLNSFLELLMSFLVKSNDLIDGEQEISEDSIQDISNIFFDLYDMFRVIRDDIVTVFTGQFIILLFEALGSCFENYQSDDYFNDFNSEDEFLMTFKRINENSSKYLYSNSKLYSNADWIDNTTLENRELKNMYCSTFVNDYTNEAMEIMELDIEYEVIEKQIQEHLNKYIDDLKIVFTDSFAFLDALIKINIEFDNVELI